MERDQSALSATMRSMVSSSSSEGGKRAPVTHLGARVSASAAGSATASAALEDSRVLLHAAGLDGTTSSDGEDAGAGHTDRRGGRRDGGRSASSGNGGGGGGVAFGFVDGGSVVPTPSAERRAVSRSGDSSSRTSESKSRDSQSPSSTEDSGSDFGGGLVARARVAVRRIAPDSSSSFSSSGVRGAASLNSSQEPSH